MTVDSRVARLSDYGQFAAGLLIMKSPLSTDLEITRRKCLCHLIDHLLPLCVLCGNDFLNASPMHELGIAASILESVEKEAARHPGAHISKVGVKIGELSGVDRDALQFGFEVLVKDTDCEPLALELEVHSAHAALFEMRLRLSHDKISTRAARCAANSLPSASAAKSSTSPTWKWRKPIAESRWPTADYQTPSTNY